MINLRVAGEIEPHSLSQLLSDILRRAVDGSIPYPTNGEQTYVPNNAQTSGRRYRIQIIEVTDPDTQQIQAVIQVVPV